MCWDVPGTTWELIATVVDGSVCLSFARDEQRREVGGGLAVFETEEEIESAARISRTIWNQLAN